MLGDRLKAARTSCGLTQQQVADFLEIDRSSYTYYETGKSKVSAETLKLLSVMFGVSYDDLFCEPSQKLELHSEMKHKPYDGDADVLGMKSLPVEERKILAQVRIIRYMGREEALNAALKKLTESDDYLTEAGNNE